MEVYKDLYLHGASEDFIIGRFGVSHEELADLGDSEYIQELINREKREYNIKSGRGELVEAFYNEQDRIIEKLESFEFRRQAAMIAGRGSFQMARGKSGSWGSWKKLMAITNADLGKTIELAVSNIVSKRKPVILQRTNTESVIHRMKVSVQEGKGIDSFHISTLMGVLGDEYRTLEQIKRDNEKMYSSASDFWQKQTPQEVEETHEKYYSKEK